MSALIPAFPREGERFGRLKGGGRFQWFSNQRFVGGGPSGAGRRDGRFFPGPQQAGDGLRQGGGAHGFGQYGAQAGVPRRLQDGGINHAGDD